MGAGLAPLARRAGRITVSDSDNDRSGGIECRPELPPNSAPSLAESRSGLDQDNPRVIQALEAYLAEMEAERKPDREAFLARHADLAEVLAKALDGLEFVEKVGLRLQ